MHTKERTSDSLRPNVIIIDVDNISADRDGNVDECDCLEPVKSSHDPLVLIDDYASQFTVRAGISSLKSNLNATNNSGFISDNTATDIWDIEDVDSSFTESKAKFIRTKDTRHEGGFGQLEQQEKVADQTRNPPLAAHHTRCDRFAYHGLDLRTGKTVELKDGSFLRISAIIRNSLTGEMSLRGNTLQRTRDLNGMLERKANEVCLFYEIDLDDHRSPSEQSVLEIPVKDVAKLRTLRCTNQHFPDCRATDPSFFRDKQQIDEEGGLTLRWKYTCIYASASDRQQNCYKERILEHIRESESPAVFSISDSVKRFCWRGKTELGGSYKPLTICADTISPSNDQNGRVDISGSGDAVTPVKSTRSSHPSILSIARNTSGDMTRKRKFTSLERANDMSNTAETSVHSTDSVKIATKSVPIHIIEISSPESSVLPLTGSIQGTSPPKTRKIIRSSGQTLTYGDGFCGAGGSTRGAVMAGLKVNWGFDQDEHACATWKANFPHASCYNMCSDAFIKLSHERFVDLKVDIMHLSPPCQYFSPAHTVNGTNDEMNVASLFAVRAVIEVGKPRVVTLEQTFGIRLPKFRQYFAALGLPQRRFRLLVIASCPGEILPKMPPPTHSENGENGLKPLVTVNETLRSIPQNAPDHHPDAVPQYSRRPWDANVILPRAMTCHGGQNYHPSGTRDLTHREYACLQGFPHNHVFRGSHKKRQIGNAVPPSIAKVLFESIKSQLDEADRVIGGPEIILFGLMLFDEVRL
ncbi:hypothetical protein B7463_g6978, partial [Scytalidium lignicola]